MRIDTSSDAPEVKKGKFEWPELWLKLGHVLQMPYKETLLSTVVFKVFNVFSVNRQVSGSGAPLILPLAILAHPSLSLSTSFLSSEVLDLFFGKLKPSTRSYRLSWTPHASALWGTLFVGGSTPIIFPTQDLGCITELSSVSSLCSPGRISWKVSDLAQSQAEPLAQIWAFWLS